MNLTKKILSEAGFTNHYRERLNDRLLNKASFEVGYEVHRGEYQIVGTYEMPQEVKAKIDKAISVIETKKWPVNQSFGVKLADIPIDGNQIHYYKKMAQSPKAPFVIVDEKTHSNGNVVYAIIRNGEIKTIYMGKNYVAQTPEKLRVDKVVSL
jgi:hypothetical protein